ncbi:MAG: hypothetical protein K9W43_03815 [Candidatus Thorarchaeota archaeon]|nr:hypothetical protein [Candidatus Thorarchaeota archaeon]
MIEEGILMGYMGLVDRVRDTRVELGRSVGRSVGRHGRNLLKLRTLLLVIAVLSPLWIMPLSAPVVSDVVVVMHHDRAVNTAVQTIVANDPHVRIVEYESLEYALTIHRTAGRVVWVSHGSENGILAGSRVISWNAFSSRIKMTPGNDLILACKSSEINKYIPVTQVIGFPDSIDAVLGGFIVTLLLRPSRFLGTALLLRMTDLTHEPANFIPLNIVYGVHSFDLNGYGGAIMYKRQTPYSYTSYYCSGTGTVSRWPGIPILNTGIAIHSHGTDYVYGVLDFNGLNYFGLTHPDVFLKEMVTDFIIISIIATVLTYIPVGLAAHGAISLAQGLVPVVVAVLKSLLPSIAVYVVSLFNNIIFQANPESLEACLMLGAIDTLSLSLGDTVAAFIALYAGLNGIRL